MSYIESMNKDASGDFLCSKDRGGSQVPRDVSHIDTGHEDLNDMEEDDGRWHKLPSRQWKSIQHSQFGILAREKVETKVMSVFEHAAAMAAITGASILARDDTINCQRW